MECKRCGIYVGNMRVHSENECRKQQEINRANLGVSCSWCGEVSCHKKGCPRSEKHINKPLWNMNLVKEKYCSINYICR